MIFSPLLAKSATPEDRFWKWFQKNDTQLFHFESNQESTFRSLSKQLRRVDEDLAFEFGPVLDNGKREFVISAGGIRSAFPAVENLYQHAPDLDRWIWVKFRQRRNTLVDISFNSETIEANEIHYLLAKDNDKIGIVLFFDEYSEDKRAFFGNFGFLYLDQALGEYDVVTKVGFIEFLSRDSEYFKQARPLSELQPHFDEYWSGAKN